MSEPRKRGAVRRFSETRAMENILDKQLKRVIESDKASKTRRAAAEDVKRITDSALTPPLGEQTRDPKHSE